MQVLSRAFLFAIAHSIVGRINWIAAAGDTVPSRNNLRALWWQARDLPFNRYAWLTTHNSFARLGQRSQTGVAIATPWNQQDTVTEQLNVSSPPPSSLWLLLPQLPELGRASCSSLVHVRMTRRRATHANVSFHVLVAVRGTGTVSASSFGSVARSLAPILEQLPAPPASTV